MASTDTGHKAKTGPFDFSFMRDQQATWILPTGECRSGRVAKQVIAQYYAKPAAYSYFVGCSTGGREGMILSQRYPTVFNGIVSGDPAMRTGPVKPGDRQVDSGGIQPGGPEGRIGQTAD